MILQCLVGVHSVVSSATLSTNLNSYMKILQRIKPTAAVLKREDYPQSNVVPYSCLTSEQS